MVLCSNRSWAPTWPCCPIRSCSIGVTITPKLILCCARPMIYSPSKLNPDLRINTAAWRRFKNNIPRHAANFGTTPVAASFWSRGGSYLSDAPSPKGEGLGVRGIYSRGKSASTSGTSVCEPEDTSRTKGTTLGSSVSVRPCSM